MNRLRNSVKPCNFIHLIFHFSTCMCPVNVTMTSTSALLQLSYIRQGAPTPRSRQLLRSAIWKPEMMIKMTYVDKMHSQFERKYKRAKQSFLKSFRSSVTNIYATTGTNADSQTILQSNHYIIIVHFEILVLTAVVTCSLFMFLWHSSSFKNEETIKVAEELWLFWWWEGRKRYLMGNCIVWIYMIVYLVNDHL